MPFRAQSGNGESVHLPHAEPGWDPLDLLERMDTFHRGDHAARRKQVSGERNDFGDFRESPGDDEIEPLSGPPRFDPLADYSDILQTELRDRLVEEGALLVVAVEQGHLNIGSRHGDGNAGKSATAPRIEQSLPRHKRGDRKTIK